MFFFSLSTKIIFLYSCISCFSQLIFHSFFFTLPQMVSCFFSFLYQFPPWNNPKKYTKLPKHFQTNTPSKNIWVAPKQSRETAKSECVNCHSGCEQLSHYYVKLCVSDGIKKPLSLNNIVTSREPMPASRIQGLPGALPPDPWLHPNISVGCALS